MTKTSGFCIQCGKALKSEHNYTVMDGDFDYGPFDTRKCLDEWNLRVLENPYHKNKRMERAREKGWI